MVATVNLFQRVLACTILLLVLLQNANSTTKHNNYEAQNVRNLNDNPAKDLLFHGAKTDDTGISSAKFRIKRQSNSNRYYPRTIPLPILIGGGGIGGFGARSPPGRGFGSRSIAARGFGGRGIGGLGRGIGGFGGRGRG